MSGDDLFPVDDVAPAVFGAEHEPDPEDLEAGDQSPPGQREETEVAPPPELIYVPSEQVDGPQDQVTIQLNRTEEDELVLLAFSSPERLAVCLGDDQPWLAVPKVEVESVRQRLRRTRPGTSPRSVTSSRFDGVRTDRHSATPLC